MWIFETTEQNRFPPVNFDRTRGMCVCARFTLHDRIKKKLEIRLDKKRFNDFSKKKK